MGDQHPGRTDFQHLVASAFKHIRSLYKLSALLRRPSIPNKYIRSISKDQGVSHFVYWDQGHVENKFPHAQAYLVHRLGLANTRRRQQMKYWEKHPDRAESDQLQATLPHQGLPQIRIESRSEALIGATAHPRALAPTGIIKPSQSLGIPSQTTKQSFSTVAPSASNDNEGFSDRSRTAYEPSMLIGIRSLRVPDISKVSGGASSFACPFCFSSLNLRRMRNRSLWK